MFYFGVDPHKENHVISICNQSSQFVSSSSFKAEIEGYQEAWEWAREQGTERVWGIENPQSYARGFAQFLLSKGEKVLSVPPQLTGKYRRRSTSKGKTDRNDSLAVARATLQEQYKLQGVLVENETAILNVLIEHYDNLKGEKNRVINRLHAQLRNLELKHEGNLTTKRTLKLLIEKAQPGLGTVAGARWKAVKSLSLRVLEIMNELKELDDEISELLKPLQVEPLVEIEGIAEYNAAKILSIVGNPSLFRNEACFANYAGTAPISCSSGKNINYRVNPGGNRQLNSVLFQIMFTQLRTYTPAKEYYEKKKSEGKTPKEAKRCLKRMISRRVFKALLEIKKFKAG